MEKPTWGDKPGTAPIIHFNGPLALALRSRFTPCRGHAKTTTPGDFKLRLLLGTPGLGKGTFASYDEARSEDLGPIQADLEFPNPTNPDQPIVQRQELIHDG